MGRIQVILAVALILMVWAAPTEAETLVSIDHLRSGQLEMVGFELPKAAEVEINAVGARTRYSDKLVIYAWIINHETRQPVWTMTSSRTDGVGGSKMLRNAEKVEFLEAGKYELYMFAGTDMNWDFDFSGSKDFIDMIGDLFDDDDDEDRSTRDILRDCYVRVNSDEIKADQVKTFDVSGDIPGALVQFNKLSDDEYIRQEFSLDEPMNIHIYSLVEYPRGWDHPVDYGWILNADSREKVWEIDRFNTERAGGGRKNRKFDNEVRLDKGTYVLIYTTDDSHSFRKFNTAPPSDPTGWGISLLPGKDFKPKSFHLISPEEQPAPLVDLTRARDNDFFEQAFELKKPASLHILALGEYSDGDRQFVDYGWIEDAVTGKTVWEMTKRDTEHAGGADKNRMFDGAIKLGAGKYVAYYVTDESHSYRDWNSSRPYQPDAWGMSIRGGKDFDKNDFALISDNDLLEDTDILVRLTRVRDREHRRGTFTLDKQARVHIYAIGEYSERDRQFVDYGWIEDEQGRTVWEMTYRNTVHAGGGDKNRMYDDIILLDKGEYRVYYITDGSHSFADWNVSRPDDPLNWGITIRKEAGSSANR